MDREAGASRYAITVLLYLSAVTIYGVGVLEKEMYAQEQDAKVRNRPGSRKCGDQDNLIFGAIRTKFSTCSWLSASRYIFGHSQEPSIMGTR